MKGSEGHSVLRGRAVLACADADVVAVRRKDRREEPGGFCFPRFPEPGAAALQLAAR